MEQFKNEIPEYDKQLYKEITTQDYMCGIDYITNLPPYLKMESNDVTAYNDTLDILEWLSYYINDESVVVVFEDSRG